MVGKHRRVRFLVRLATSQKEHFYRWIHHHSLMHYRNAEFRYPKNTRFSCSRCMLCCGNTETKDRHILTLEKEAKMISKVTLKPVEIFACRIAGHEPYVYEMKKDKYGRCIFLGPNTCTIYALRPLVCRCYPFELKHEENGSPLFFPTSECPGLGVGEVLEESFFVDLFRLARELVS